MAKRRDVAIVGVYATKQERFSQRSALSLTMEAIHGALDDAGLTMKDVDGYLGFTFPAGSGMGVTDGNVAYQLNNSFGLVDRYSGAMALLQAAAAIREGLVETVIIAAAGSRATADGRTVAWTRPEYEFTEWTGSMTPAQFALQMRRHMHEHGTTVEQMAYGCATVRNNGHKNPDAIMFQRGPYTVEDVLSARMVADPLTLLMCSIVNDGGNCMVVTSGERARACKRPPVWVLSGAMESRYTAYFEAPSLEMLKGREKMMKAFGRAGVRHEDVDIVMIYDHFASGLIMSFEGLGFCEIGEGGPYIVENIGLDDKHPVCPDGGNLSFSHPGNPYNFKAIEIVRQFRGDVNDLCPQSAEGVHTYDRSICRKVRDPKLAACCGPMTGRHSFAILAKD